MENPDIISRLEKLTLHKREILKCFCYGMSTEQIADKYSISEGTVRAHINQIYIKLELDLISIDARRAVLLRLYCEVFEKYVKGSEYKGKKAIVDLSTDAFEKEAKEAEEELTPEEKEREKIIDDMVDDDHKALIKIPPLKAEPIYAIEPVPQREETRRRINPFKVSLFVFALIGFAAVAILGYELITGGLNIFPTEAVSQGQPATQEDELSSPEAEQVEQAEVILPTAIPTSDEIIPTESPTYTPPPKPAVLFEDDFGSGLSDAWEIVSGNPIVVNGMLSADQDTWLLVGDPGWKNYSVEFNTDHPVSVFGGGTGFNVIGIRAQNIDNMYAFSWGEYQGESYIIEDGNWAEIPQADHDVADEETNLMVSIINGQITIYENGIKAISFFDSRFENGRIALRIFSGAVFDNFKVKEILE